MNTYYRGEPVTPSLDRAPAYPFDPAPSLTALRAEQPIARLAAPQHTRFRKPLAGKFTVRRMNLLTARVTEITRERLDAMERQGPPAHFIEVFTQPVPALMICELLGVPYEDRNQFQSSTRALSDTGTAEAQYAFVELGTDPRELALAKRAKPTEDR